jgi:hypothetical protein
MSAHRSVFEHPAISRTLVACFPPILQVRPQQDEPPDHFAAPFRSGALPRSSSRWRVALGCKIVTAFQRHRSTSKVRQALTAGVEASTTRPLATTRWLGFALPARYAKTVERYATRHHLVPALCVPCNAPKHHRKAESHKACADEVPRHPSLSTREAYLNRPPWSMPGPRSGRSQL